MLLDDFFCYKAKALAQAQPFEVHLHPHINVNDSLPLIPTRSACIVYKTSGLELIAHVDVSASFDELNYEQYTTIDGSEHAFAVGLGCAYYCISPTIYPRQQA
jgi:hypothetical protein